MSETEVHRDLLDEDALFRLHRFEYQVLIADHPELKEPGVWQNSGPYWVLDNLHKADLDLRKKSRIVIEKAVEKQNNPKPEVKSIVPQRVQKARAVEAATVEKRKPGRPKGATVAPKAAVRVSGNLCRKCDKVIEPTGKKGRPAAYHDGCRPVK
jgi:hypothetical protein